MMSFTSKSEYLSSSTSAQPCHVFSLAEIQLATNDFDDELIIGKGGFGKVYKGSVCINETIHVVAIKRLDSMSKQGATEFKAEIKMLSTLRHCNLVSLIGYCDDNMEMILVYVYMPHGTLYDHLHKFTATPLSWIQRLKIAIGAGRGLDYLHTGVGTRHGVIHRDVKSSNILLDENWAAMISDFGLSKIGPIDQTADNVSVSVKGTFGYLDPEYFYTRKLNRKTDVYAFGVLLFELLSGMLAVDERLEEEHCSSLASWAQKCVKERKFDKIVDSTIRGTIAPKCLRGFAEIANRCLIRDFEKRPSMTQVVAKLQDLLELQEKCDNSADSPGTSGFTWMIHKYRATATNQNSGQGGAGLPKSNENHMNQGSSVNRDGGAGLPKSNENHMNQGSSVNTDGGAGLPKSNENHMNQGSSVNTDGGDHDRKPHQHGDLVAGGIKRFTYDELKRAKRKFKNDTRLGVRSYDESWIYKTGYSPCMDDTGLPILVKIVDSYHLSDLKMFKEFRHPNVVKVIGYCNGRKNLVVSEFVHNGNLENLLRTGTIGLLPLATKVKVAVGIARGIVYLCNTENNDRKVSYSRQYDEPWDWDWEESISISEFDKYKILLDEDFTAKLLEHDIVKLIQDSDYYGKRDPRNKIVVDECDSPVIDFSLETKIFSCFRSVFTEVLTGRKFSLKEFHKIDYLLRRDGKQSLGLVAKSCYENCNTIDSEQMMLKYFEEYENYIHMGTTEEKKVK